MRNELAFTSREAALRRRVRPQHRRARRRYTMGRGERVRRRAACHMTRTQGFLRVTHVEAAVALTCPVARASRTVAYAANGRGDSLRRIPEAGTASCKRIAPPRGTTWSDRLRKAGFDGML